MSCQDKFVQFQSRMKQSLIEREEEVDLSLIALLTGNNVFFCGAPGTAKSMLANMLVQWIGGEKFSILMTKHTMPEELYGPMDVQAYIKGEYRVITKGMLPEASVAFLDEIWKASSAISNTLLQILNEGTYTNNGVTTKVPLKACIACSNETPNSSEGGRELAAMFDRFLLRKFVQPVSTGGGKHRLLWGSIDTEVTERITDDELKSAKEEVYRVTWSEDARDNYTKILDELAHEGIIPGDRRKRLSTEVCRASAWLAGSDKVESDHLEVLAHTLWVDPEEQPKKTRKIVAKLANPVALKVTSYLEEVAEIEAGADKDDIQKTVTIYKKLGEVQEKLQELTGKKAEEALEYVHNRRIEVGSSFVK